MAGDVRIRRGLSFAFDIVMQIIQFKIENNLDVTNDVKDLLRVLAFEKKADRLSNSKLRQKVLEDIDAIKNRKIIGVSILSRFEEAKLKHCLKGVLQRYYQIYIDFQFHPESSEQLLWLESMKKKIFVLGEIKGDKELKSLIKAYKASLKDKRTDLIGVIYLGVMTSFQGHKEIKAEYDYHLITGIIALQLGLIDEAILDPTLKGVAPKKALVDSINGAYKKLMREKIIEPKHFEKASV